MEEERSCYWGGRERLGGQRHRLSKGEVGLSRYVRMCVCLCVSVRLGKGHLGKHKSSIYKELQKHHWKCNVIEKNIISTPSRQGILRITILLLSREVL